MSESFLDIFTNILSLVREPIVVLDSNLKVVKASLSFYRTFCVKPEKTKGVLIYDLGNREWDIPRLRELLEDILPENTEFKDFEVEHVFETIGPKIMHLNARRIYKDSKKTELILMAIEDVTEKEQYKRHLETMVEERTAELTLSKQEVEQKRILAETSLQEIERLRKKLEEERAYLKEEIKLEHNHEIVQY